MLHAIINIVFSSLPSQSHMMQDDCTEMEGTNSVVNSYYGLCSFCYKPIVL